MRAELHVLKVEVDNELPAVDDGGEQLIRRGTGEPHHCHALAAGMSR